MDTQRGFTLIEVLIAVGIVALVATGAVGMTLSSRSLAVNAAAGEFDSLLDAARTTARAYTNGATIAFTPDPYGDGFVARLYHNRPGTAPLEASTIPAVEARVSLTESEALGAPAFALAIHAGGAIAGIIGNATAGSPGPETPCPGSGAYHFVFAYAGVRAERSIPCRITLASTGNVVYATPPAAIPIAPPTVTPCLSAPCAPMPTSPNPTVTCPPNFVASRTAVCTPVTAPPGPTSTPGPVATNTPAPSPTATGCSGPGCFGGPKPTQPPQIEVTELQIIMDCDAGAPGSFFDLVTDGGLGTMADVSTWLGGGTKRFANVDPLRYDPATPVHITSDERHEAPPAQQCVP